MRKDDVSGDSTAKGQNESPDETPDNPPTEAKSNAPADSDDQPVATEPDAEPDAEPEAETAPDSEPEPDAKDDSGAGGDEKAGDEKATGAAETRDEEASGAAKPEGGSAEEAEVAGPKRRSPLWARLSLVIGIVLVLLSGSTLVAGKMLINRYTKSVHHADMLGDAVIQRDPSGKQEELTDQPINVLLVGIDKREDERQDEGGLIRADSVMVLHIPKGGGRAYMFSIPRDTVVDIPAFPESGYSGGREKLAHAFAHGAGEKRDRAKGFQLLARTLKNVTGLAGFNAAGIIDFAGFVRVVQAMGGVELCVDVDTPSIHKPGVVHKKGCRLMDGELALDYVRQRKTIADGDYGRQRHQQQFLKAVAKQARTGGILTNPGKLDGVIRAAGDTLTVQDGGYPLTDWALALGGISADNLKLIKTPGRGAYGSQKQYLGEQLDPIALEMFRAVREGTVDQFITQHPELVNAG